MGRFRDSVRNSSTGSSSGPTAARTLPYTTNLIAWYPADLGAVRKGSYVAAWLDMSGNGHMYKNTANSNDLYRPTYSSSDSNFNNKPTVTFDGNDGLAPATWGSSVAQPVTLYICGSLNATGGTYTVCSGGIEVGVGNGGNYPYMYGTFVGAGGWGTAAWTSKAVMCFIIDGNSSKCYKNDSSTNTLTTVLSTTAITDITLGYKLGAGNQIVGTMAEYIYYSGAHDQSTRYTIMSYLGTRYGVTVT